MAMSLRVVVPPHPLIGHWLTVLRVLSTPPPVYKKALEELGRWLTYEALRDWLPTRKEKIKATNIETEGTVIETEISIIAIPNLPGGLELWHGARTVLPNADIFINDLPVKIKKQTGFIIFIDQIKEGDELIKVIGDLQNRAVETKRIRVITTIASSPGLKKISEKFEDLSIYCACIDEKIDADGNIIPGIGNPSLRLSTIINE
tara:strand:- start:1377 stop:1988 length:612 start_codon:yes stop_codon:yes gene_type:complete